MTAPLLRFKSHIEGKNADVSVYADRVEWVLEGRLGTGGKLALGAMTMGASLLKTGVSGKTKGTEMIPVKSISSVTTERDGIRFTKVRVITSGNTIDFRVDHGQALGIKETIGSLVLGTHPALASSAPPPPTQPSASTPTATGVADELKKLVELRDAGILSDTEFDVQKSKLLG